MNIRPFPRRFVWIAAAALAVAFLLMWARAGSAPSPDHAPVFPQAHLAIQRADGKRVGFDIELATTREQETYGLMFRRKLAHDAGMLFVWSPPQNVSMWMKDTLIPLDMLFVDEGGIIVKIAANAAPLDLTAISSGAKVAGVIEINGGEAARQGLKPGDKVLFSTFGTMP